MARIPGRLVVDLFPNGTVRIVFIAGIGGGNETPLTTPSLDEAEVVFMTCGLNSMRAAALRAEFQLNKVASAETTVDEKIAAKFRYTRP
jgi:hypothetical protein